MMIVLTGGAGFIGSNILAKLNKEGISDVIIVDNLGNNEKWKNLVGKHFEDFIHKTDFLSELEKMNSVETVIHMGACSSTTESDANFLMENNYKYSKILLNWCMKNKIRFIYASSAATYGNGSHGYEDDDKVSIRLKPLNMYGFSKQLFDEYIITHNCQNQVVGLKFFNVFGPNEYHKKDMQSMVIKAVRQIQNTGKVKLFKSKKKEYKHGEQKRDFIYVKDVVDVVWWFFTNEKYGIYNVGSGKAKTWLDLANAVFKAMGISPKIEFIDLPKELWDKYQYFTQANISKLRKAGYDKNFTSLEDAIYDYVTNYLLKENPYL